MLNLKGLVIAQSDIGEAGRLITLLTAEMGCVSVYVRAGQKSRTARPSTQLFSYAEFSLSSKVNSKNETNYYFNSAEPITLFYNIRLDAKRTALACYFAEILKYVALGDENADEVMRLTLNTLYFLNEGNRSIELLKSIFELRLMCETGFRPNLIGCAHCYKALDERMHFNLKSGLLECNNCVEHSDNPYDVVLDETMLYIVRFIALVEYDRLFNFRISDKYQRQLTDLCECYCEYCCSKKFDTLKFYRLI